MIGTVGTDIIELERVRQFIERGPRYLERLFTDRELKLGEAKGNQVSYYAGRFAAKEAVAKCLGPPFGWHEVEILSHESGKPFVELHGAAKEAAGDGVVVISIAHCRGYATAVAILEKAG